MNEMNNPMGVNGFDFIEFAAPDANLLHTLFKQMGFVAVAKHNNKEITLYRQNDINFLINEEENSFAADFAKAHGPCACGFAIRVKNPEFVCQQALAKEAKPVTNKVESLALSIPVISGIGDSVLYLVDDAQAEVLYEKEFTFFDKNNKYPQGFGLTFIDHLTHNVYHGNMDKWAEFYERLFNFREIRYFDIKGAKTGLHSRAMTAPDGKIRIPINESEDEKSQIVEYLNEYKGEGIQHIALYTDDIYTTVEAMREQNIQFLNTPDTYYEVIDQRIPDHGENLDQMQKNKILIDGKRDSKVGLLLQIFTETNIGPIFFEIIQRKGNEGFGEGNFQALFESIERDQMKRGVL